MTSGDVRKRGWPAVRGLAGYAVIAAGVWLGWEVVKVPVVERAPPALALRLAPESPEALRRAAEAELLASEWDDAAFLADRSLATAPFNARALRVRGLAAARTGATEQADQLLTLAGNWSLRDDPAHAWLVERRLRQGSYGSAFAHADTLARRRRDLHEQVFNLFSTAAIQDPRALPPLVRLLAANPPWRPAYLGSVQRREGADALLMSLGIALQSTPSPLSDPELSRIYRSWSLERRYPAIRALRAALERPSPDPAVQNGDFATPSENQSPPFNWTLGTAAGLMAEIVEDDLQPGNLALRVSSNGYRQTTIARQLLLLVPGRYQLSGRYRPENVSVTAFEWSIRCVEGAPPLIIVRLPRADSEPGRWTAFASELTVPNGCTAQHLLLQPRVYDRQAPLTVWFDDISIAPAAASQSPGP